MVRLSAFSPLLLAAFAAGCAEPAPPPADPATVERLVAGMEARPKAALPPSVEKKLEKADRISDAVTRIQPERIDPDVAAALIVR